MRKKINTSNCPNCIIYGNDANNRTSGPRDCVLSVLIGKVENIFPFVRSLRTTGSMASIVLLMDDKAFNSLSPDTVRLLKNCSIQWFNIGVVNKLKKSSSIFAQKHIIAYDFIYKSASMFDRMLLIDLYDVVFQDDPFFSEVDPNSLIIIKEARLFGDDPKNRERVEAVMKMNKFMYDSHALNGGVIYGSPIILLKYETLYFSQFNISNIDGTHKTCDQGYMNYLYLSGELLMHGFKLKLWHRDQGYESLASTKARPNAALGKVYFLNKRAIVIHMFDRSDDMIRMVLAACPQGNYAVAPKSYTRFRHNGLFGAF